jgi:hypothetical protein
VKIINRVLALMAKGEDRMMMMGMGDNDESAGSDLRGAGDSHVKITGYILCISVKILSSLVILFTSIF